MGAKRLCGRMISAPTEHIFEKNRRGGYYPPAGEKEHRRKERVGIVKDGRPLKGEPLRSASLNKNCRGGYYPPASKKVHRRKERVAKDGRSLKVEPLRSTNQFHGARSRGDPMWSPDDECTARQRLSKPPRGKYNKYVLKMRRK